MRIKSQKTRPVRESVWETFSPPQQPWYKRQGCFDRGTVISNKRETRSTSVKGAGSAGEQREGGFPFRAAAFLPSTALGRLSQLPRAF